MIFASRDATTLMVAAAGSFGELEAFYAAAVRDPPATAVVTFPDVTDMLLDPRFAGLRHPPYLFVFTAVAPMARFVADHDLKLVPPGALRDLQQQMLAALAADPYASGDTRPIAEVHELATHDPWDGRSAVEKQQDDEHRRTAEAAKAAGKLSGDSFAPSQPGKPVVHDPATARVTDIRTTRHADGSVTIDDVLAVKGLHDDNGKGVWRPADPVPEPVAAAPEAVFIRLAVQPRSLNPSARDFDDWLDLTGDLPDTVTEAQRAMLIVAEGTDASSDWCVLRSPLAAQRLLGLLRHHVDLRPGFDLSCDATEVDAALTEIGPFAYDAAVAQQITPGDLIALYHRLDVSAMALADLVTLIRHANAAQQSDLLTRIVAARGQLADWCWLACATKAGAETLAGLLPPGTDFEIYGVNDRGERLVPKGVEIVEAVATAEPPRPWNDKAAIWAALDDAARNAKDMRLRGDELIFCGSYRGAAEGCIVHITPRRYFNRTNTLWDGVLEAALLPPDLKSIGPAVYCSRSRDWTSLNQDLSQRGMTESLGLQLYINTLD